MKKANRVTNISDWMIEGREDKRIEMKYAGVILDQEWKEIFSTKNNLLFRFSLVNKTAYLDILLANAPPFIQLSSQKLTEEDKWENVLGQLRNTLKKQKDDFLHHRDQVDNLYAKVVKVLR